MIQQLHSIGIAGRRCVGSMCWILAAVFHRSAVIWFVLPCCGLIGVCEDEDVCCDTLLGACNSPIGPRGFGCLNRCRLTAAAARLTTHPQLCCYQPDTQLKKLNNQTHLKKQAQCMLAQLARLACAAGIHLDHYSFTVNARHNLHNTRVVTLTPPVSGKSPHTHMLYNCSQQANIKM